jgi:hypothetical protein
MAYTEADYVQIRKYLGYNIKTGMLFPNINSVITETQSVADGGIYPDDSAEIEVKALILELRGIDASLAQFRRSSMSVLVDGKIHNDFVRAIQVNKMEGRRLVGRLCDLLNLDKPLFDAFSPREPANS